MKRNEKLAAGQIHYVIIELFLAIDREKSGRESERALLLR